MDAMALIGHTLHYSYSDMLEMDLSEFDFFRHKASEVVKV